PEAAVEWAGRALELAGRVGAVELRPGILVNQGSALTCFPDRVADGAALLEQAVAEAEAHGEAHTVLRGLRTLFVAMARVWPAEQSHGVLERMAKTADAYGQHTWAGEIAWLRASLLAEGEGDLDGARDVLRALDHDEAFVDVASARWAPFMAAQLAAEADDPAVVEYVERARRYAQRRGSLSRQLWVHSLQAELAARQGDVPTALAELDRLRSYLATPTATFLWDFWSDNWYSGLLAALRAGAEPGVIRDLLARAEPLGPAVDHVHNDPAWPDHLDGGLAEAEGRFDDALDAYRRALAGRGRRRWVPQAADVHQGLARCLMSLGQTKEARAEAEAAAALLARWPGWRQRDTKALLRRLGVGPATSGPGELSDREREVAALLAEGLTNAEIARRLFISPKTASVHVSHILTKLGMSSRAEVAAWAVRAGLAD
ncbi:MAG: LuxR C-terminal-related transcriptional regulator, partial [Acidimicrobiia bacterium]